MKLVYLAPGNCSHSAETSCLAAGRSDDDNALPNMQMVASWVEFEHAVRRIATSVGAFMV
jgi:hypothetical protein